jgi:hypothetical protein
LYKVLSFLELYLSVLRIPPTRRSIIRLCQDGQGGGGLYLHAILSIRMFNFFYNLTVVAKMVSSRLRALKVFNKANYGGKGRTKFWYQRTSVTAPVPKLPRDKVQKPMLHESRPWPYPAPFERIPVNLLPPA